MQLFCDEKHSSFICTAHSIWIDPGALFDGLNCIVRVIVTGWGGYLCVRIRDTSVQEYFLYRRSVYWLFSYSLLVYSKVDPLDKDLCLRSVVFNVWLAWRIRWFSPVFLSVSEYLAYKLEATVARDSSPDLVNYQYSCYLHGHHICLHCYLYYSDDYTR